MLDRYDQDLLLDYLEGELDADRRAKLDAMLAEDPQLAALLSEMAMDRAALRSLPEAQAPAELVHDVTKTLERRMLLDEPIDDIGPIPLSRGRGASAEPTRSISWGRVVGLTGLAASVALAAGIVVITLDDPLERAADSLASSPTTESASEVEEAASAEDLASLTATVESSSPKLGGTLADTARPADALAGDLAAERIESPKPSIDPNSLALRSDAAAAREPLPPITTAPELDLPGEIEAEQPLASFAFGSTAAISVIQPRQQLVLLTESPEVSLEHLFAFCVANGIPIVQPDEQARLNPTATRGLAQDAIGFADDQPATQDDQAIGDYALLINESQLNTLVKSLNTDVNLEPSRAGKASLISNQAAVLAEVPEETSYQYGSGQARQARILEQDQASDLSSPDQDKLVEIAEQQAVQLRLPSDLGSDYANTRNAYNLKQTKKQSAYTQEPLPAPLAEAVGPVESKRAKVDDEQEAAPQAAAKPEAAPDQANSVTDEALKSNAGNERITDPADAPLAGERDLKRPAIDPARGNWLSAHLPTANTTPLLLQWRNDQSATPTSLVPIRIKRAEPDKVNTLRKRQQVELANREDDSDAKADAQPVEAVEEIESQPDAEPAPPAEDTAK